LWPSCKRLRARAVAATAATTTPASAASGTSTTSITAATRAIATAIGGRVARRERCCLGSCLGGDLGRHLAGDAELIRLPALLADDGDQLLEPLLQVIEVVALLLGQQLGDARGALDLDLVPRCSTTELANPLCPTATASRLPPDPWLAPAEGSNWPTFANSVGAFLFSKGRAPLGSPNPPIFTSLTACGAAACRFVSNTPV